MKPRGKARRNYNRLARWYGTVRCGSFKTALNAKPDFSKMRSVPIRHDDYSDFLAAVNGLKEGIEISFTINPC